MKGLRTAIRTLTLIPFPGKESDELSSSLPWFPIVGLILGTILYLTASLWSLLPFEQWSWGGASLILLLSIWLTMGLHMDGLADWADSLGGFGRDKRLAIMKDSSIGAFGVIAVALAIIFKLVAFERMLSSGSIIWVIIIPAVSRGMLVELQTTLQYARSDEGMAGPFIKNAMPRHRIISHLLIIIICLIPGLPGLTLYIIAFIITAILKYNYRKHFKGITGDLLGASNEIIEIILLMACAIPGEMTLYYTGWNM